ncbi:MAG: DUF424 family protein [Methanoregulaceae archaeon]|nr:DUF424 family protein [Methanoregulaceae archaeon]
MYMKIHRTPAGDEVVAVCDRELLNVKITHGDLEIHISEAFYGGSLSTPDEVRKTLTNATNANLMGARTVALAVELGLIAKDGYINIGSTPHAQIIRI